LNCQEVEMGQFLDRYLAEELTSDEAEAFEQHLFECDRCFPELKLRHAAVLELRDHQTSVRRSGSRPGKPHWHMPLWAWAGMAAAVLLGVVLVSLFHQKVEEQPVVEKPAAGSGLEQQQLRAEIIGRLGRVDVVPPYLAMTIRGAESNPAVQRFRRGMQSYAREDYAGAIGPLREAVNLDAGYQPAIFYLGISYLLEKQPVQAAEELRKVSQQTSSTYRSEALWYLAKAFFQQGEMDKGREQLERLVQLGGEYAEDAARNLELSRQIQ